MAFKTGSESCDSQTLIRELKNTLSDIDDLNGVISSSRFLVLFPDDVLTLIKSIDQVGMYSSEEEYFSFLKIALSLWMTVNMGNYNYVRLQE